MCCYLLQVSWFESLCLRTQWFESLYSPLKSPKTQWFESRLPLWETPKSTKKQTFQTFFFKNLYCCLDSWHSLGPHFWWAVECIGYRDSNRCAPEHSDSNHCSPLKSPKTQWFESRLPLWETPKSTKKMDLSDLLVYYCFSTHQLGLVFWWAVECIGYRDSNRCAPEHSDSNHCSPLKSPKTQWFESRLPLIETPKSTKKTRPFRPSCLLLF